MIRSSHITTTIVAATSLAATFPSGATAHHIVGHETLAAVQQDIQAASDEARRQVSSAQYAIENTGASTRRHVVETAETQVRSAERTVTDTRSSTEAKVESARRTVERRVVPVVVRVQQRAGDARAQGEERAERSVAAGRSRAQQARSTGEQRVARTRALAEERYETVKRRAEVLAYRITREVEGHVASGSVGASTSAGEYSAGWTRSGACWTGRLSTPLQLPNDRLKRRTGKRVEPVKGYRAGAETSNGDVTLSTGC